MPFTFSHPAAILPIRSLSRGTLPLLALVIGSIAPDFGYYLAPTPYFYESAHTIERAFTFCLPMGFLLLTAIWLVRSGLLVLLPAPARPSVEEFLHRGPISPKMFAANAVALIIGAFTHIFWDGWTHRTGYFVYQFPALREAPFGGIEWFRLIQHSSSAVGAVVIILYLRRQGIRPATWPVFLSSRLAFWALAAASSFAIALATEKVFTDQHPRTWFFFLTAFLRNFATIVGVTAAGISFYLCAKPNDP